MKKFLSLAIFGLTAVLAYATNDYSSYKGVWANDLAEAVVTDSVCLFYEQVDSTMQATLEIAAAKISHRTIFAHNGSVSTVDNPGQLQIELSDGKLTINGKQLEKVEDIETTAPYQMSECVSKFDVGKCLQEWRLGCTYTIQDGVPCCEINTNRHMFVYLTTASMVYIRAAATRNNNHGTLFFQNIRMMKNHNTGEYTMTIHPDNKNIAMNDLEIDNSKFQPNSCTFNHDGGIYWSLISFKPDEILINGCGETYQVHRPSIDSHKSEWIKYAPYSNTFDLKTF